MNREKLLKWGVPILAHGIAWALAAWLGLEKPAAETFGVQGADWLIAGVLIALSFADSYRGRAKVRR